MVTSPRIPQKRSSRARQAAGLPPAGDWIIETSRSSVSFCGRASRLAPTVRAQFSSVQGGLHLAANTRESRVGVSVDVRTVTTGNPLWDELLRAADPFQVARHPLAHFQSAAVVWTGSDFRVEGELELGGITTSLALTATFEEDAGGTVRLNAEGKLDPRAVRIQLDIPGARLLMPRTMNLSIAVVANRAQIRGGTRSTRAVKGRRFALAS